MFYLIDETLVECDESELLSDGRQFVAILTPEEWRRREHDFDMGIDFEPDVTAVFDTQAEANYDSITGTIFIPDRADPDGPEACFAFAMDEKGIVFIDTALTAERLVRDMSGIRRWRDPSLARFFSAFVTRIVRGDAELLREYERELDHMEIAIMDGTAPHASRRINEMRGELRDLSDHYDHLMDLMGVLMANENGFFPEKDLRYFRVAYGRLDKMHDQAATLRDQALQMRDLYKMHLDVQQNHIVTVLTVVTAIFAPLTLIVGWYGMNFRNMPELDWEWGYPLVVLTSVVIVLGCYGYFKRRGWL
ncbi:MULTISPECIES: CorA family divalent cation transporter [Olsenella]|uniref:magnesium transporter CorA family protein n=1 Tax=Olsenella TaxID=133925 RepID=UPI00071D86D6|nr:MULTISPECIES: CorA family divalent cation transporter [Olsenella]OFK23244.1 magnesium transporter CorA [Olsenella sp. HMSC062G07]